MQNVFDLKFGKLQIELHFMILDCPEQCTVVKVISFVIEFVYSISTI